jgi:hydroxypyruvate isomerase
MTGEEANQYAGRIRQSLSWWCYARNGMEPERLLREAARIGYASVELVGEQHWPLVKEHGLRIAAVGGHGTLTDGMNKRENHDRIADEIAANLEKAVQWQIPNLIVFSGNRNGLADDEGAEITAACLRRVAPLAEQAGVNLVLELLNSKVNHPDYQADHTTWGVRVCEMVGSPRVKLLYDIYHMQVMEGDVISCIRENIRHIGHFHTAGVPGRHDLDEDQELNYLAIVRAIAETGYDGFLGHEFIPKGEPIAAIEAAFRTCNV